MQNLLPVLHTRELLTGTLHFWELQPGLILYYWNRQGLFLIMRF